MRWKGLLVVAGLSLASCTTPSGGEPAETSAAGPDVLEAEWLVNPADVLDVAVGAEGTIWSAGAAGLATWSPDGGGRLVGDYARSDRPFFCVDVGPDGRVWAGGDGMVAVWDGAQWTDLVAGVGLPDGFAGGAFLTVGADSEGAWFGTRDRGAMRVEAGRVITLTSADGLGGDEVVAVVAGTDGGVWLAGRSWLVRVEGGRPLAEQSPRGGIGDLAFSQESGLLWATGGPLPASRAPEADWVEANVPTGNSITTRVDTGPSGEVWIGGDGLWLLRGDHWANLGRPSGVRSSDWLVDVEADGEGGALVAVAGRGLARWVDGTWIDPVGTLAWRNSVGGVSVDGDGRVYLGAYGAINVWDAGASHVVEAAELGYTSVAGTAHGAWFRAGMSGFLLDGSTLALEPIETILPSGISFVPEDTVSDADQRVWGVTQVGGLGWLADGGWQIVDEHVVAYDMAVSDNHLLALGSESIWAFDGDSWQKSPNDGVAYVGPGGNGTFWFVRSNTLVRSDGKEYPLPGLALGLNGLAEGLGEAVWMATADGLTCTDPSGTQVYGFAEGMPTTQLASVLFVEPNALWVTSYTGAFRLTLAAGGCPTERISATLVLLGGLG